MFSVFRGEEENFMFIAFASSGGNIFISAMMVGAFIYYFFQRAPVL
jgi:hypothetical protein